MRRAAATVLGGIDEPRCADAIVAYRNREDAMRREIDADIAARAAAAAAKRAAEESEAERRAAAVAAEEAESERRSPGTRRFRTVEVRGWQGPRGDGERCLFSTLRGLLGCDDVHARRLASQFGEQGSVAINAKSRESAEGLSEYLQGLGALVYLAPREGPVTFIEAHVAAWGTLRDDRATCQRVTSSKFHVTFDAPTIDYISGETTARPAYTESFSLAGVSARSVKVIDESEDSALLDVELIQPLRPVAFVPDRTLCRPGGIGLETAMRLVRRQVIVNWISEDLDYWYFHFFDGGGVSWHFTQPEGPNPPHEYLVPNCFRVSKQDGVCARIARALPA